MESVIKTVGCPLDPDLLKSFERFSLESSHFHISSNHSESSDEEAKINHDHLIEQPKTLSSDDVSDFPNLTSKCTNKVTEISAQIKNNSEKLTFVDTEENLSSSFSLLKKKEFFRAAVEAEQSMFCKSSNKNYEINSKKNNTYKQENLENIENELSSMSLKDNKFISKCYKNSSSGDESESDDDEQDESVILRERDPTRRNRPENNKPHRTTPFSRNCTKNSKPNFNWNNSQTSGNFSPYMLHDFNGHHDGYSSTNHWNSTDYKSYGVVPPSNGLLNSCFPTSEWLIDEGFEVSVSTSGTDQVVDGVVSSSIDELIDGFVPYPDDIGNASYEFFEETNDMLWFDNLKERIFTGSAVTNIEKEALLDSCLENLTAEEVEHSLKDLSDSTSDDISLPNNGNLARESSLPPLCIEIVEKVLNDSSLIKQNTFTASNFQERNNQHNFHQVPDCGHSSFSKTNVEKTSSSSNFNEKESFSEQSGQIYNSKNLMTHCHKYSTLVCKNISLINCESLSPKALDYIVISNEIEHEIAKRKEIEEQAKKGQNNLSGLPHELPFDDLDDKAILEFLNPTKNKMSKKNKSKRKNDKSKRKNNNQTCQLPCKAEKTKICWILGTVARDKLFHSSSFCIEEWEHEDKEIKQQIGNGNIGTQKKKVIHVLPKNRKTKYRGTNLHQALLSGNIEKVFCIVECHKKCHDDISEINIRDTDNKTVLDYSIEREMDLLTDYLKENLAQESINV